MSLYKMIIGEIRPENPVGDGGRSDRVDDIKAHYASGEITKDQFDELIASEATTLNYIRLKRLGMVALLATVGFFILL